MVEFEEGRDIVDLLGLEHDLAELLTVDVDVVSAGSDSALARQIRQTAISLW